MAKYKLANIPCVFSRTYLQVAIQISNIICSSNNIFPSSLLSFASRLFFTFCRKHMKETPNTWSPPLVVFVLCLTIRLRLTLLWRRKFNQFIFEVNVFSFILSVNKLHLITFHLEKFEEKLLIRKLVNLRWQKQIKLKRNHKVPQIILKSTIKKSAISIKWSTL